MTRLGINIDLIATIRNARGSTHPDPLLAAKRVVKSGAHSVTIHLREDRRHIKDDDVFSSPRLNAPKKLPFRRTTIKALDKKKFIDFFTKKFNLVKKTGTELGERLEEYEFFMNSIKK